MIRPKRVISHVSLFLSVGLPLKDSEVIREVKMKWVARGSIIRLTCDQREWMQRFLLPIQTPHARYQTFWDQLALQNVEEVRPYHIMKVQHPKVCCKNRGHSDPCFPNTN